MAGSNFPLPSRQAGFTLIETLLAITLLSGVAIGLFYFFTNAMMHTSYNQGRTVAVNVARGVAVYFEKNADFSRLKEYMEDHQTPFLELTKDDCGNESLAALFFPGESGQLHTVCEAQFAPKINNVRYEASVYLVRYDKEAWDAFTSSSKFTSLPAPLQARIRAETEKAAESNAGGYMIKLYTSVRWGERTNETAWVEGVITDETIR
ncbi:type II secretion system protein [Geobacillus stearothermophilus]|uniref:type IV pilus modification PilV family protein n=1 Tax=Geobacillus TaxID=129337 RepID=UPI001363E91E|nr:type II secretion system protein [Geobacillus sp. YHL]MCG6793628.1 type II secretion system protein [Geobacillus sp. YHL]QHN50032.1 type II secretion system protein [Geobacillus stearothermophilus]